MKEQMKKTKNSKKRKRMKRKLASMTATVLVLTVGMMGTMAYLSTVSKKKINTFTGSAGISLELTETEWGIDADGDGDFEDAGDTKGEGYNAAQNYTPGTVIKKNPVLTNTTTDSTAGTEWVAIAVSYKIKNVPQTDASTIDLPIPYSALKSFIKKSDVENAESGIAFYDSTAASGAHASNSSIPENEYWIPVSVDNDNAGKLTLGTASADNQAFAIYLYNKALAYNNTSTKPLFEQVVIKEQDATTGLGSATGLPALNTYLKGALSTFNTTKSYKVDAPAHLPNFEINVIGAAIKNEYSGKSFITDFAAGNSSDQSNLSQLKTDLVSILQSHIDEDARKLVITP